MCPDSTSRVTRTYAVHKRELMARNPTSFTRKSGDISIEGNKAAAEIKGRRRNSCCHNVRHWTYNTWEQCIETLYCSLRSVSSLLSRAMNFSCSVDKSGARTICWVESSMGDTLGTFFIHLVGHDISIIIFFFTEIQKAFSKTCRNHSGYG